MEQEHRDILERHCDVVIPKINMLNLWPKLLENRVYIPGDVNIPRWTPNLQDHNTIKDIFLKIQKRGPKAFDNLIQSLRETNHDDVADILETNHLPGDCINRNYQPTKKQNHNFYQDIQRSNEPLKIHLQKAIEFMDGPAIEVVERYPMRSNPRGLVLLITNIHYNLISEEPRLSAQHDRENLKDLFTQMGFRVITHDNLTGKEIKENVREFSKRQDLNKVHSCFVIFTSHGTENETYDTEIQGVDFGQSNYEKVTCKDIIDYFTAETCPALVKKPKIFIFQLCRGSKKQRAIPRNRPLTDTCVFSQNDNKDNSGVTFFNKLSTRNYSDVLIVQSTIPGHVAYRDSETGSWFIQILCSVFMSLAYKLHVQDLFNTVDSQLQNLRTVCEECQTSSVDSIGFNKHCYINPGLFEENVSKKM